MNDEFLVGWNFNGYRAFFEQDDATAYLYLADEEKILFHLHIYNRSPEFRVREEDVAVQWNHSGQRCGVVIFGKLRGVIGINGDMCRPSYVMRGEGITDLDWREGFQLT
jgi:hypothetical protein